MIGCQTHHTVIKGVCSSLRWVMQKALSMDMLGTQIAQKGAFFLAKFNRFRNLGHGL